VNVDNNPILNNPYKEPPLYYKTDMEGSLDYDTIEKGRRPFSSDINVIPVKSKQDVLLDYESRSVNWQNHLINRIRKEVGYWRNSGYNHFKDLTKITKDLLFYWFLDNKRIEKLFFAQREAIETAIWLNEVAEKSNSGQNLLNLLKQAQDLASLPEYNLPRIAFKMATGTGKTVVMAMQILYHFLNRRHYPQDVRFADYFIILTPGITIKDRLNVLFVDEGKHPASDYYSQRKLVPHSFRDILPELNSKIFITNFHSLEPSTLKGNKRSPFDGKQNQDGNKQLAKESPEGTIKRLIGSKFKKGRRLLVLNDEAHHCYLPKDKGKKTEESDTKEENVRASVWFNGIVEISKQYKVRFVYDLSATPYFLSGSGYEPYSIFPWTVSDFGLIEAIESGLVKIPFLPESDTSAHIETPVLKNLYDYIKHDLPKKLKVGDTMVGHPRLPPKLRSALDQFYAHYEEKFSEIKHLFDQDPVFIVVCNNTTVSSEVYKYIAGYEVLDNNNEVKGIVDGKYPLFSNYKNDKLLDKPPTLLIDSEALENSEQIDDSFKKVFAREIEEFKKEYRRTRRDKSVEDLTDSDILREVVNTVGKTGKLGAYIRCIVSVNMLTEGWDVNTVTHIVGIRAFNSQLLCEQVAGRALRRKNYFIDPDTGKFPPEYAHIIGIPFQMFKPGKSVIVPPPEYTRIWALPDREHLEIRFPNIKGYRLESKEGEIRADFSGVANFEIEDIPRKTNMGTPFAKELRELNLNDILEKREQEIIYILTKELISQNYSDENRNPQFYKFKELKDIVTEWFRSKITCLGDSHKNMIVYYDPIRFCSHIQKCIVSSDKTTEVILPVFSPYNRIGSTKEVNGNSSKTDVLFPTKKSHVNYVVPDSEWETIAAKALEENDSVISYVKNSFLGFSIPYIYNGVEDREYFPDFIVKIETKNRGIVNLILEISGFNKDKADKKWYVENRWLPAANSICSEYDLEEWFFLEVTEIGTIKEKVRDWGLRV
jgi:type III restriction enzyme